MDFCTFVRDYGDVVATLLVGIVGFVGVIWTLRENARLAREQHDRTVEHERQTVRTALLEELRFLKLSFEDRAKSLQEWEQGDAADYDAFVVPTDTMSDAYARLVDRIGLLSSTQAAKTLHAYLHVRQLPAELRLLSPKSFTEGDSRGEHWIRIERKYAAAVRQLNLSRAKVIDDAIKALEVA